VNQVVVVDPDESLPGKDGQDVLVSLEADLIHDRGVLWSRKGGVLRSRLLPYGLSLCVLQWSGLAIIGVSGPLMALRDGFWSNRAARVKRLFGGK